MGCGASCGSIKKPIIAEEGGFDLHEIYLAWAKYQFTLNNEYKSCHEIEINDRRVICESDMPIFNSRPEEVPTTRVMFTGNQDIKNKEDEMTFRFKNERKTKSMAEVNVSKNLVKDGKGLNIPFNYPKLDERSGLGSRTILSGERRQVEEHEIIWEVDTEIKAKGPGTRKVDLRVTERHLDRTFFLDVAFRGQLLANLWDVSSGTKKFVSNAKGRAEDVLSEIAGFEQVNVKNKLWAKYTLKGTCNFRYAIEQHVVAHEVECVQEDSFDDEEDEDW